MPLLGDFIFEAIKELSQAVGEFIAYAVGKIIGRCFDIEAKKAQKIGENVVLFLILISIVFVTLKYS